MEKAQPDTGWAASRNARCWDEEVGRPYPMKLRDSAWHKLHVLVSGDDVDDPPMRHRCSAIPTIEPFARLTS